MSEAPVNANDAQQQFHFRPVEPRQLCSRPLYLFLLDYTRTLDMFFFAVYLAANADRARVTAAQALLDVDPSEERRLALEETIRNPDLVTKKLTQFSGINSRNLTNNIVDSFLWYISAIIQAAMRRRPQLVKSKEMVSVEEVIEFKSRRELVEFLIDRKINALSYSGLNGIQDYIDKSLGLSLFSNSEQKSATGLLVQVRNVNAHHRGFVNRTFLSRIPRDSPYTFREGERAHLDYDKLAHLSSLCVGAAIEFDDVVSAKFSLPRKRFSTWKK